MPSSYVIGDRFERFIKEQISQGRYASASEVIRDGLRALEDRERFRELKLQQLREDIRAGMESGPVRPVTDVANDLKRRYQGWAEHGAPTDAV